MAYATGSLTDANSSLALYNVMAGLLTTAGYTLVDTVVISTRTHKVWLSPAASNSMHLDWYLDVAYNTTGVGPVHWTPFEYFDAATDLGYRGPHNGASSTIESTYHSRYGAVGYALESTNWLSAASGLGILTSATSFSYWLSINADRVIGFSSLAPQLLRYAGFYDPRPEIATVAGPKLFPLCKLEFDAVGAVAPGYGALTRLPPATTLSANNAWREYGVAMADVSRLNYLGKGIPNLDDFGLPAPVSRIAVGMGSSYGYTTRQGWAQDVRAAILSLGVSRGDTVDIDGSQYICLTGNTVTNTNSTIALMFKAI